MERNTTIKTERSGVCSQYISSKLRVVSGGGRGRDSRSHPGDGDQTLGMRGLGASENVDLSPDVWGASPSRSAPPLGGQTALLVRQKHHLSGSECESGSGGVLWAAEWFVRERVWTVMSWVCIFRADVHLPLDLDQGIIFRMRKCKQCIWVWSVGVDLSCSTQPPPSSLTKSRTVKKNIYSKRVPHSSCSALNVS